MDLLLSSHKMLQQLEHVLSHSSLMCIWGARALTKPKGLSTQMDLRVADKSSVISMSLITRPPSPKVLNSFFDAP